MASGGSYTLNDNGDRVLIQRSGHATPEYPEPSAEPASTEEVDTDENP
jgi:hypothetical protein